MLAWTTYLLVVSGVMSLSAVTLERAIRPHGFATRWTWIFALLGSLALPLGLWSITGRTGIAIPNSHSLHRTSPVTSAVAPSDWSTQFPIQLVDRRPGRLDALAEVVWPLSSGIATSILFAGWWYGRRRRREWRRAFVAETEVLVSQDAGPAAVGLLHPRIVLPEWLLIAAPERLRLIVAHERSHVEARDPALLGLGLGVAVLMPWNPLVWWQVSRLRLAIEVDCDQRVLRLGHDARRYARTLADVSMRRPAHPVSLAASRGSRSSVERRIILMSTPKTHGWRATTAASALLSVGISAASVLIAPPAIPLAEAGAAIAAESMNLDRYVGKYEVSTVTVLQIGLRNGQLFAIYPEGKPRLLRQMSEQSFRCADVDAYIRFVSNAAGQVTGLVFQQNGAVTEAPRIDLGRAQAIASTIQARIRAQAAAPGGKAALRKLILGIEAGKPNYGDLSPQLAAGTRALLSQLQRQLRPLGALRSVEFRGIDARGWDKYVARFERGTASWEVSVDSYGVIVGAGLETHPQT